MKKQALHPFNDEKKKAHIIMKKYQQETLYQGISIHYENLETFYHEKNDLQDVVLFNNPIFGKMLMLDGVTQVTLADEFIYHEMMAHVPLFSHPNPRTVLIIGGGDGGIAREVLRHKNIDKAVMIEIDADVVEFSKKHLPEVSNGVFENLRLDLRIEDGALYVANTNDKFDVIIVDSTDPFGPGEVLFSKEFYQNCAKCLTPDGILVTQNGVPFMQADELKKSVTFFREIFNHGSCYRATIPTYAFGEMAMGWATNYDYNTLALEVIAGHFEKSGLEMRYYTPEIHKASFAHPVYLKNILKGL